MPYYRLHRDPRSSHQQIAATVRALGKGPVLDVGAAQGFLGQLLDGEALAIDAVEPNPEWADACRPHYRQVMTGTVEQVTFPNEKYRVIVCADVLEHTVDPVSVLRRLREIAADDATFVISLPNVAHAAVRTMLLFGYFPRMERGILDKTHLHFFTRDTAAAMLRRAGLSVARASATGVPLDELWKRGEGKLIFRILVRLQHLAVAVAPRLFGFQWIFTAIPAGVGKGSEGESEKQRSVAGAAEVCQST